jgi:predicted outer membrane repeat protein
MKGLKNMLKKFSVLIISLAVLLGIMMLNAFTADAAVTVKTESALFNAVSAAANSQAGDRTICLSKNIDISNCLRIPSGEPVTIDLNGYTLNRGLTECRDIGSVIRVEPGATLTVKDSSNDNSGIITGGASWNGGGICNHGTLTVEGGTIRNNKALHSTYGGGGGIYNGSYQNSKATLTLKGGVIINNDARCGAGIYNSDGTVIIQKGSYSVTVLSQLKKYDTNVTITKNEATDKGSGIYTETSISIQDSPKISGNKNDDDILLRNSAVLKYTGKLNCSGKIGVSADKPDAVITSGYLTYHTEDPINYFKSYNPNAVIRMSESKENVGEVMLKTNSKTLIEVYNSSKRSIRKASELLIRYEYDNPSQAYWVLTGVMCSALNSCRIEMTLGSDWIDDMQITVPSNIYFVIDLNGHRIVRNRNGKKIDNGGVFMVREGGVLVINDSNPTKNNGYLPTRGGMIIGGCNSNGGGGITVEKNGELYMNGGTIYDCRSDFHGGGICAMDGAKMILLKRCCVRRCITHDSWDDCNGGGIYAKNVSRFELENVTIRDCSSEDYGGGFYYYGGNNGIFIVSACTFQSNNCNDDGGAAYFSSSEGGYFDKCYFNSNSAGDDGGCIYTVKNGNSVNSLKKEEPVMIRECEMTSNVCGDEGSAVFVDRNDVVFVTDTIKRNHASDKGAVYVSHNAGRYGYDISVKGLMVITKNESDTAMRANIVLENYGATHNYIYCAGLYEGSEVVFSTLDSGKTKTLVNVDKYQMRFFHSEKGSLSYSGEKTVDATLATASIFSDGKAVAVIVLAGVAVCGAIISIIYKKKKGDAENDDDNE